MREYIPDFDEIGERSCERHVVGDKIRCCGCGELKEFNEVSASGPSPWSAPICDKCLETPV